MGKCNDIISKFESMNIDQALAAIGKVDGKSKSRFDVNTATDDEIKKIFPHRYKEIIARRDGKSKKQKPVDTKKLPKSIEDKIVFTSIGSNSANKEEIEKGVFKYTYKSSKFPFDVTVDTKNKVVIVNSVGSDDYLELEKSAKNNKYKIKKV